MRGRGESEKAGIRDGWDYEREARRDNGGAMELMNVKGRICLKSCLETCHTSSLKVTDNKREKDQHPRKQIKAAVHLIYKCLSHCSFIPSVAAITEYGIL